METLVRPEEPTSPIIYRAQDLPGLFAWMHANAIFWLRRCNIDSEEAFSKWADRSGLWIVPLDAGLLLITDWLNEISISIHPIIIDRSIFHDTKRVKTILYSLANFLGVERIEAHLLESTGRTLRRWMTTYGFRQEGTLRLAARDYLKPGNPLISVEIWATLKMELLED